MVNAGVSNLLKDKEWFLIFFLVGVQIALKQHRKKLLKVWEISNNNLDWINEKSTGEELGKLYETRYQVHLWAKRKLLPCNYCRGNIFQSWFSWHSNFFLLISDYILRTIKNLISRYGEVYINLAEEALFKITFC